MKRLIYMDDTMDKLRAYAERKHNAGHTELANGILKAVNYIRNNVIRADAVEVVHGYWVSDKADILFHCSVCETQISTDWDYDDLSWNYCPNCGAKMDGGKNG
ncbi:MAG: hypothetical protein J6D17_14625 [Bacteroides sp.]|nr:hypothetical protein [Bacteroides sp.]